MRGRGFKGRGRFVPGGRGRPLLDLGDGIVDGLGDVVDVLGGQATHVDAAAGHQVDVLLPDHELHLFGCRTTEQQLHTVSRDHMTGQTHRTSADVDYYYSR